MASAISACSTEPSVERRSRRCGTAVPFGQPPQRAVRQRLQGRRAHRDGVVLPHPQRLSRADRCQTLPLRGSAPGTPAAARRANCVARRLRSLSSIASDGAHATARSRPTTAAADSTGGAAIGSTATPSDESSGVAHCATSATNGDGSVTSSPLALSTAVTSNRPPGASHRGDQQPSLLGQQRSAGRHLVAQTVEHVEQSLGAQHATARCGVGPQPVLQAGDDDQLPIAAQRCMRAEDRDRLRRRGAVRAYRRQL